MIPQGWQRHPIGQICESIVPGRNKPKLFDGDIPWVTTPEIRGRYLPSSVQQNYVSEEEIKKSGGKKIPAGSVVMAAVGDLGLIAIASEPVVINQQLHAFVCPRNVSNEYIAYFLSSQANYMKSIASKTTIPYMNKANCESIPVLLPAYAEQQRIAEILSTWDRAIEAMEKLIANSEAQKKALMQQLLSGKTRLPGFHNEWKRKSLVSLATIRKGTQKSKVILRDKGLYPVINGGIRPSGYTDESNAAAGTITISEGGNSCGYVSLIQTDFWSGGHCYTLNDLKINRDFLFSVLKWLEPKIMRLRVGSGLPNIQKGAISQLEIPLPEQAEQVAIADIMNDQHAMESAFQSDLEKLKREKAALMQQLLTGKRRVAINKEEAVV